MILADILINYCLSLFLLSDAKSVKSQSIRKFALISGIVINIVSLLYFKYTGFLSDILSSLSKGDFNFKSVMVPLGISYITFSQIAFLVDSYRDCSLKYSLLDYSLFILFFPKITVGPIAFTSDLIPQFNDAARKQINYDNISKGITAFAFGLAKKVLLADNLASIANWGYENIVFMNSLDAFVVMLAYTLQIYFDFSGYCDMAQGVCLMLNLELPINFDSPYRALSVNDFWKRWHITLTRFFRQYVYFPLGGSRKGKVRTYINIFIIFFLSGLWHGASFTFIIWGMIHGIFMCLSKALMKFTEQIPKAIRFIGTFLYVNITWIFFRATDLNEAIDFIKKLFCGGIGKLSVELSVAGTPVEGSLMQWLIIELTGKTPYIPAVIMTLFIIVFSIIASTLMKNTNERIIDFKPDRKTMTITVILLIWSILSLSEVSQFIYVNF